MRSEILEFNVSQLLESLSNSEREEIHSTIRDHSKARADNRYARLHAAEVAKNELIDIYEEYEHEIAKNNEWFFNAKEGKLHSMDLPGFVRHGYADEIQSHRRIAESLYFKKKTLIERDLPAADEGIAEIVRQIEMEESQERLYQKNDLEALLLPLHKKRENERLKVLAARAREAIREREREEEQRWEERRQEEIAREAIREREREEERQQGKAYLKYIDRMRAEAEERHQIVLEGLRKRRAEDIRAKVLEREIPYIVHFTPIENLESILDIGLRSRNALMEKKFTHTDDIRADGWLDWVSTSVAFPNYKMFYPKRLNMENVKGWAVVIISTDVLWELDCRFILTNAARNEIRMFQDDKWSSVEAFESMFGQKEHRVGLPDYFTTDPQAEVMIKDEIPIRFIKKVVLERAVGSVQLQNLGDIEIIRDSELFKPRQDWESWQGFRLDPFASTQPHMANF